MTPQIVHRGNEVFPAFCGHMDIGNVSSMSWEGVACIACLAELPQPQWHVFNKDDESTWPKEECDCWIIVEGEPEPQVQGWDPNNLGPERGWDSYRAEYVRFWMPIEVPEPPG